MENSADLWDMIGDAGARDFQSAYGKNGNLQSVVQELCDAVRALWKHPDWKQGQDLNAAITWLHGAAQADLQAWMATEGKRPYRKNPEGWLREQNYLNQPIAQPKQMTYAERRMESARKIQQQLLAEKEAAQNGNKP